MKSMIILWHLLEKLHFNGAYCIYAYFKALSKHIYIILDINLKYVISTIQIFWILIMSKRVRKYSVCTFPTLKTG